MKKKKSRRAIRPKGNILTHVIDTNQRLWFDTFWVAWDQLDWDEKFAWIFFISNTIALITIIEVLVLAQ